MKDMNLAKPVRERPKAVRLTERAAARVREIIAASGKPVAGVRLGVEKGGCAGQTYTMEYAESAGPHDEVVEDKGVRILIEPKAILYLIGTELDYVADKLAAKFVFNNPNASEACGCGESVTITPAKIT